MTRQPKTPHQRAQEALDVANRHVVRLDKKIDALRIQLAGVEREHRDTITRRDYLDQHPDLAKPSTTSTTTSTGATH